MSIVSPGVVSSWAVRLFVEMFINMFGLDHISLALLLVENGVLQRFAFVEDRDVSLSILTNSYLSIAQGIAWAGGLDLVDDLVVLDGEVFGYSASFLVREDLI